MKKIYLSLNLFLFVNPALFAQIPSNPIGLNPYSLKWSQIHTDKVQVIFPQGLESQGQRVANLVHYLWDNNNQSVGTQMKKVSILLQNQTITPNGFVTVGPFRSEFFTTPPQFNFNGTSDWLDMLAIHEYRHVKQYSNANKGLTRLVKGVFGQYGWATMANLALPRWYWEGDAVGTETALSQSGRGRLPEFDMEWKSLLLSGRKYNYEKAAAGSIKHYVPSFYNLGYYMTTYARRNFGEDIWTKVVADAVRYKGLLYTLSHNLKKYTGLRSKGLYKATFKELDSLWKKERESLQLTESKKRNTKPKDRFTDYKNAQYFPDGRLIAEKSGFAHIRNFYLIESTGKETWLLTPGINNPANTSLSASGYWVCWAEQGYHPRWTYKNYSIIKTYNLLTKKRNKISSESRYFAPALSQKADKIVTVEISENLQYALVILNTLSGEVIKKLPNPDNRFISFPRWMDEDKSIVFVSQKGEENKIQKINIENNEIEDLSNPTSYQITNPFPQGEYVYFSGAYTGINNIFALKKGSKDIFQVTSVKLGAFQPATSADGKKLIFSEFTAMGYDLSEVELNPENWKLYNENQESSINYYQPLAEQEGGTILDKIPNETFPTKKYNKWSGIINPHSLAPNIFPPNYELNLYLDNKFSTLSANAGVNYNTNENEFSYSASLSYAELFPYINLGFLRSDRTRTLYDLRQFNDTIITATIYNEEWTENDLSFGLSLPVNISQGSHFTNIRLSADYHIINLDIVPDKVNDPEVFRRSFKLTPENSNSFTIPLQSRSINALDFRLRFVRQQSIARQNILPRFAQIFDLRYRQTVNSGTNKGKVFNLSADMYFPGLLPNHSLYFNFAYQKERFTDNYKFRNNFFYPRGYGSFINDDISKIGVNYTLPLWCPDLALSSLVFIKRIKANLFYDSAFMRYNSLEPIFLPSSQSISSMGLELRFDFRAFRTLEVDLGFRYSYLIDLSAYELEFLFFSIGI